MFVTKHEILILKGCISMGEHTTVEVFKQLPNRNNFLMSNFQKICWRLYDSRTDSDKTKEIYREIGFVHENGTIFDLSMRFHEENGAVYQSNYGVFGAKDMLPNLQLSYKFSLPEFWLAILKPNELKMSESGFINAKLTGEELIERIRAMYEENRNSSNDPILEFYTKESEHVASIENIINPSDLIFISVGLIFYEEGMDYRDVARKEITSIRKNIASRLVIPHWRKSK
jgi:hypothetical protein